MKKCLRTAALVLALALLLCTTAFAVDALETAGNTVTFVTEGDTAYKVMNVSFQNDAIQDGKDYMIWVIAGKDDGTGNRIYVPTASSILYIGQAKAEGNTFSFDGVYPREIVNGTVVISGPGMVDIDADRDGLYTLATIYEAGDTNVNGVVDVGDVTNLLRYLVELEEFGSVQDSVADVNRNGEVEVGDATQLLRYLVGLVSDI